MGTFTNLARIKLDPWFCVACDLVSGTMKLPCELTDDPYPGVQRSDIMAMGSETTARIYVRAPTARAAKQAARRHLKSYMETRPRKEKAVAA